MSKLINFFLQLATQIKLYHWQTQSYARHRASDQLNESIISLSDKFVEIYIGKYGRPKLSEPYNSFKLSNMNDTQIIHYLRKTNDFLRNDIVKHINTEKDTDLMNIRDELLGVVNQTLYLFTLE